jgi:hypothetical protein
LIDGGSIEDFPDFTQPEEDNVDALNALTEWLMDTGDYKTTPYYTQISSHFSDEQDQKSFALRLIIHYVGDLHQPLHTVAGISDKYPKGDAGGNFEHVPDTDNKGVTNLHAIWDSVSYSYTGFADLPMSSETWAYYGSEVENMAANFPVDPANVKDENF